MTIRKRALLVGVDKYDSFRELSGCVNDVDALAPLISFHADGSPNFQCRRLVSDSETDRVDLRPLSRAIDALLGPGADVALLYFAGHGSGQDSDVILCTQDGDGGVPGVALSDVLARVRKSQVRQVIIILDCCFSGAAGRVPQIGGDVALLKEGLALLAASRGDQTAAETADHRGAFSSFLCGALDGGASDVLGDVSLAGIYAYVSESFDAFEQRPTFKANLEEMYSLRRCEPAVPLPHLRRLTEIFPEADLDLPLDPSYDPESEPHDLKREETYGILQQCRVARLVVPVGETYFHHAVMNSKACRLTPMGKHFWSMAKRNLI